MAQQNLGGPHSGEKATIVKGDTMSRSMGQYGQDHSFTQPQAALPLLSQTEPTASGPNGSKGSSRRYPAPAGGMGMGMA